MHNHKNSDKVRNIDNSNEIIHIYNISNHRAQSISF